MTHFSAFVFLLSFLSACRAALLIRKYGGDFDSFMANAPLTEFIMMRFHVVTMLMLQCMASAASYIPRMV